MRLIFLIMMMNFGLVLSATAEQRIALVIGNSDYATDGWDLENPTNDADLLAVALAKVGFEVHTLHDGDKTSMEEAFQAHADRLKDAGEDAVGFFFYAGHGAQHRGVNYLVAADAQLRSAPDLMRQPKLDLVMDYLEYAGNRTNFIVLDACRNNPLPASMRSAPQGLASSQRVRGTLIAYSTAPGMVADDGFGLSNSAYSAALAALLTQPGYSVETLFRVVATRVEDQSEGFQIPWTESGLRGEADFCFAGCELVAEDDQEAAALAEVVDSDDPLMMEVFLDVFPETKHRNFLESRMRQLEIERSAADEIERERASAEFLRETLGVTALVSEQIAPWSNDPQQITARLGMEARIAQKDPAFEKLEDAMFVFFDENSSSLSDQALEHLSLFATYIGGFHVQDFGPASLTIVAACSPDETDMTICQDRAFVVRDQLIANGIYDVAFKLTENWGSIRQISASDSGLDQDALNRYAAVMLLNDDADESDDTALYDVVE
jgi:outer membrane protein OmpA-like peptidoglycan-associated protein